MVTFLVSYDLIRPRKDYSALNTAFNHPSLRAKKVLESTFIVKVNASAIDLANHIISVGQLDADDKLFVVPISFPYAYKNVHADVVRWIDQTP